MKRSKFLILGAMLAAIKALSGKPTDAAEPESPGCGCVDDGFPSCDCHHCIDVLPIGIPEGATCNPPSAWIVPVPCPECMLPMSVVTGDDVQITCVHCGTQWSGRVHCDGIPESLMWNLERD